MLVLACKCHQCTWENQIPVKSVSLDVLAVVAMVVVVHQVVKVHVVETDESTAS